jgi:hypothetical protein
MGRLILVKCDCGFIKSDYKYGCTVGYSNVQKHLTALVKSGHYGELWRGLVHSDPELLIDASWAIYQCADCHQIFDEFALDLYKKAKSCYAPNPDEVLHRYKHLCPNCKKKMERIPLYLSDNVFEKQEELVICPKCGDIAIATFCGYID